MLSELRRDLRALANPAVAEVLKGYFKTGPGQYGEGDQFLGLKVPQTRSLLPRTDGLSTNEVLSLLHSEWHEERLLALMIWVRRFDRAKADSEREDIFDLYVANFRFINNWDLVDTSAPPIVGSWLMKRDHGLLTQCASSTSLWERRIAILATLTFIRAHEFKTTLNLVRQLLHDPHDLMHKACGWMLREVGKRDESVLTRFLDQQANQMPRTMLRYAIEKLAKDKRTYYMG